MTVVELNPGGGWYTEILANYIHYPGTLIAAQGSYYMDGFKKKMDSNPMFGRVEIVSLSSDLADPNSIDAIVTFRNLHNWLGPRMDSIFKSSMIALKPGGIIIYEHGCSQQTEVVGVLKESGFSNIQTIKDFQGLDRIVYGYKC
jgi:predicted methyltransferase